MAEDMIERVAKRLWDDSFDRMPDPPWEETHELQKQFNRMLARSAIAALHEPTPAMVSAGIEACDGQLHSGTVNKVYAAMIAALTGHETGGRNG